MNKSTKTVSTYDFEGDRLARTDLDSLVDLGEGPLIKSFHHVQVGYRGTLDWRGGGGGSGRGTPRVRVLLILWRQRLLLLKHLLLYPLVNRGLLCVLLHYQRCIKTLKFIIIKNCN